ncbi:sugar transferase [Singulisphaera sp. PoT]|uniref:sugar transferase n=1 Tax=Singulisphaera sp. PoT TaxID=3411797 RepID=UPI003BF601D6
MLTHPGTDTAIGVDYDIEGSGEIKPWETPSRYLSLKAVLDVAAASVLAVVLLPVILISMIVVKLTSPGPSIYSQIRLGRDGRPFRIYKIRTMRCDSEVNTGPRWSSKSDPYVTPVGRFLRKSHLDELPQLWNILKGEMSLVGPRPERPEFVSNLEKDVPRYCERLLVRPGVTGLAQIQLPPDVDLNSVRRKLVCDLAYIERLGFSLDLRILLCTAMGMIGIPYARTRGALGIPTLVQFDEVVSPDPTVLSVGA